MPGQDDAFPTLALRSIGVIHTPHKLADQAPIQPVYAAEAEGTVEVVSAWAEGLRDIDGFSHIYLFYWFHKAEAARPVVQPGLGDKVRGVFAARCPHRPNPIGISVVRLIGREENVLRVKDVDMLDGSPLLDIKPYVAWFDQRGDVVSGWLETVSEDQRRTGRRG